MQSKQFQAPSNMIISKTKNNKTEKPVPLVSILCATFNQVDYIKDCLDGFLMQKVTFPIEIIVRDDASNDGTSEIVCQYEEKHPNLFRNIYESENQYSKGVRALPVMKQQAKGKYIALCEGDDYWTDPDKLQKQVNFLESNLNFSGCCHRAKLLYPDENCEIDAYRPKSSTVLQTIDLLAYNPIKTASMVIKQEALVEELPDSMIKLPMGDWPRWALSTLSGPIFELSDVMSVYRVHESGLWSRKTKAKQHLGMIECQISFLKEFSKKYHENIRYGIAVNLAHCLLSNPSAIELNALGQASELIEMASSETFISVYTKKCFSILQPNRQVPLKCERKQICSAYSNFLSQIQNHFIDKEAISKIIKIVKSLCYRQVAWMLYKRKKYRSAKVMHLKSIYLGGWSVTQLIRFLKIKVRLWNKSRYLCNAQ